MESDDGLLFLEAEDVVAIHTALMERTGAFDPLYDDPIEPGILNEGGITSAVERARWGPFREGGHLSERTAYLVRGIVRGHPFVDGNKRTGFEAADVFLRVNGRTIRAPHGESRAFLQEVARGLSQAQIREWIRVHTRRI